MKSSKKCRHILLLSLAAIIHISVFAQHIDGLQQKATTFYSKRQYDSALITYQQLYKSIAPQKPLLKKRIFSFFMPDVWN